MHRSRLFFRNKPLNCFVFFCFDHVPWVWALTMVMSRRLELRGRELFVNESLTKLRGIIFRSLLAAKREGKIYTVFSRNGNVFY